MDYAGEHGFGLTMTCRRNRLPKDIPSTYWHKERTDSGQRCKVARFFNPVVAVKDVIAHEENKAYRKGARLVPIDIIMQHFNREHVTWV